MYFKVINLFCLEFTFWPASSRRKWHARCDGRRKSSLPAFSVSSTNWQTSCSYYLWFIVATFLLIQCLSRRFLTCQQNQLLLIILYGLYTHQVWTLLMLYLRNGAKQGHSYYYSCYGTL